MCRIDKAKLPAANGKRIAEQENILKIGIIGAGNIGGTLARHLAKIGHEIRIANSRGPQSLAAFASEISATAVTVTDAAAAADIVIISIPQPKIAQLPKGLFAAVPQNAAVIDTGNYYPSVRDSPIPAIDAGMLDSEWVARQIGRPVIKAFNNIGAQSLRERGLPPGAPGRIALSAAGDPGAGKALVLQLFNALGFDAVDTGLLEDSWRQEPGTPAYCRDLDAADLAAALQSAKRELLAQYRAESLIQAKRIMAGQSRTG